MTPPVVWPSADPSYQGIPSAPWSAGQDHPRLWYGAEDKDAGMYVLDGQTTTVEEAVEHMQFYKNSRQIRPPLPKHEVVKTFALENDQAKRVEERKSTRQLLEMQNRVQDFERALLGHSFVRVSPRSLESRKELLARKANPSPASSAERPDTSGETVPTVPPRVEQEYLLWMSPAPFGSGGPRPLEAAV